MKTIDDEQALANNKLAIELALTALRMICPGLGSVSLEQLQAITKPLAEMGIRMSKEIEEFNPWNKTEAGTPPDGEVALIHVTALGEHGYITAWFDVLNGEWVALDDEKGYTPEDAPLWTYEYPKVPE